MTPMHKTLLRSAVLALTLAATACGSLTAVTDVPSAPPVAASWANAPAQAPVDIPMQWWEAYGSRELTTLIATAHRNNPDLAASVQRIARARAQARAARAGLFPSLDASAGSSRRWPGEGKASNAFQAGLDAAYEVDLWGGIDAVGKAAAADVLTTVYQHDAAALSLDAEVASTYFQVLNLGDRLDNARRVLAIAERVLDLVETQARLGAASGLEVSRQRGAVASLRASIPSLERSRAESLNALAELIGTTPDALAVAADSLDAVILPAVAPGLPSTLLERRPDLRAAEAGMAAAAYDVQAARAALLPSVRLTGSGGFSSTELSSLFSPTGFLTSLAAGLTAPLFDGGRLRAQRDAAEATRGEAIESYRAAVLAAFRDVEDALAATRFLAEIEEARADAVRQAEESYAIAEARYRVGRTDFLDLLDAQRTLFEQQDAFEEVRLSRLTASVSLYRALGGGWAAGHDASS